MARRKNQPRYSLLQKFQKLLQKRIRTGPTLNVTEGNTEKVPAVYENPPLRIRVNRVAPARYLCKGEARFTRGAARLSFQKTLAIAQFIFYNIEFIFRGVAFCSMTRKKQLEKTTFPQRHFRILTYFEYYFGGCYER